MLTGHRTVQFNMRVTKYGHQGTCALLSPDLCCALFLGRLDVAVPKQLIALDGQLAVANHYD